MYKRRDSEEYISIHDCHAEAVRFTVSFITKKRTH